MAEGRFYVRTWDQRAEIRVGSLRVIGTFWQHGTGTGKCFMAMKHLIKALLCNNCIPVCEGEGFAGSSCYQCSQYVYNSLFSSIHICSVYTFAVNMVRCWFESPWISSNAIFFTFPSRSRCRVADRPSRGIITNRLLGIPNMLKGFGIVNMDLR